MIKVSYQYFPCIINILYVAPSSTFFIAESMRPLTQIRVAAGLVLAAWCACGDGATADLSGLCSRLGNSVFTNIYTPMIHFKAAKRSALHPPCAMHDCV